MCCRRPAARGGTESRCASEHLAIVTLNIHFKINGVFLERLQMFGGTERSHGVPTASPQNALAPATGVVRRRGACGTLQKLTRHY